MAPEKVKFIIDESETLLATIRGGVLVHLQDGLLPEHLNPPLEFSRQLNALVANADDPDTKAAAEVLTTWLGLLSADTKPISDARARSVLDQVTTVEAALLAYKNRTDSGTMDVNEFVDESFNELQSRKPRATRTVPKAAALPDEFEVDDEMMEIFREEADALLENIRENLEIVRTAPDNLDALWEIKRNAHTFKGAAGIVGLKKASKLAHRIESLLARVSEDDSNEANSQIVALLLDATDCLALLADGSTNAANTKFDELCVVFDGLAGAESSTARPEAAKQKVDDTEQQSTQSSGPRNGKSRIVRISLDRLDDLVGYLRELVAARPRFAEELENLGSQLNEARSNYRRLQTAAGKIDAFASANDDQGATNGIRQSAYELAETTRDAAVINAELAEAKETLDDLAQRQHSLFDEMHQRLLRLRKVEFGTITTRLQRTVGVTCDEEGKQAELFIENPTIEVDTQVIDLLIEPLMHLLKNAIVHGIETPETRRMLGKRETGKITIRVDANERELLLRISDDGRGIAFQPLLDKAVAAGVIEESEKDQLTRRRLHDLLFVSGLTTAEQLTLNAGRGVGMGIIREALATVGGMVEVETTPQRGTTFTIAIPQAVDALPDLTPTVKRPTFDKSYSRGTLVVVDDSPSVRKSTEQFLKRAGWQVVTAGDGFEALDRIREMSGPPVAVVSDIEMPLMGGYELIAEMRRDEALKDIPVVFVSSRSGNGEREKALEAGAETYLTKPCDEKDLLAAVDKVAAAQEQILVF